MNQFALFLWSKTELVGQLAKNSDEVTACQRALAKSGKTKIVMFVIENNSKKIFLLFCS